MSESNVANDLIKRPLVYYFKREVAQHEREVAIIRQKLAMPNASQEHLACYTARLVVTKAGLDKARDRLKVLD